MTNIWRRGRRYAGSLVGLGLLVVGGTRCSDLTAPAQIGNVVIEFADPTVATLAITVGDTVAPPFRVMIGSQVQQRARYVYSVKTPNTRLRVIRNGDAIEVLDRGLDTVFATVVGAAIGGTSSGAKLIDTLEVIAAPADNKVEFQNGTSGAGTLNAISATAVLNATSVSSQGVPVKGGAVTWSSTDLTVVSVTPGQASGDTSKATITSIGNGTAEIVTVFEGIDTVRTTIAVQQKWAKFGLVSSKSTGLTSMRFRSLTDTATVNGVAQDSSGIAFRPGADFASVPTATFRLSDPGKISLTVLTGTRVRMQSDANGFVGLWAEVLGVRRSDSVTVQVLQEAVSLQIVGLRTDTIPSLGDTRSFSATALDSLGRGLPPDSIVWTPGNSAVATISGKNPAVALGVSVGTTTVTAASGNQSDQITLAVRNDPNKIELTPDTLRILSVNDTVTFAPPVVTNTKGTQLSVGITYHSLDSTIAEPLGNGTIWGKRVGSTRVFAQTPAPNSKVDTSRVVVTNAPATINILPTTHTFTSTNESLDSANVGITIRNSRGVNLHRAAANWRSGNEAVARVTSDSSKTIISTGVGDTYIYAYSPLDSLNVKDSLFVAVSNNTASLTVSPSTAQTIAAIGSTINFTATARNASGAVIPGASISWSVLAGGTGFLSIDAATGVATALANGSATVRATSAGITVDVPVTVAQAFSPAQSTIIPAAASLVASGTSNTTITIQLKDANGNNLTFGGATVVPSTSLGTLGAVTDAGNGRYTATLTSSPNAGTATITATVNAVAVNTTGIVSFTAGTASKYLVTANNSAPVAGSPVTIRAQLADANNNPVATAGSAVTFTSTNGGSFTGSNPASTDLTGAAIITFNTAPAVSSHTITATTGGLTGSSNPINSIASAATSYTVTASTTSPAAGSVVTINAQLRDANGNAVAEFGRAVTWTKSDANGSLSSGSTNTNAAGVATVNLTTHTVAGTTTTVTATTATPPAGSITGTTASITTINGGATQVSISAGNGQSATVGTNVTTAPSVLVRDANNNPVAGVTVTFAVASGGGSATNLIQITDASGIATVGSWTLGTTSGANTLTATAPGLAGSPITFTATATPDAVANFVIGTVPTQTAGSGFNISITARDQFGNTATGFSGAGNTVNVTSTGSLSAGGGTSATFTNGALTHSVTVGNSGSFTITVTRTSGAQTGTSNAFTVNTGSATQVAINAGNGQTAVAGAPVGIAPSVIVRDGNNNPVSGIDVTFAVTGGAGTISSPSGSTVTTNASGVAALSTWILGTAAGANSLSATAAGLAGSPLSFTATGTPGTASAATSTIASNFSSRIVGQQSTITVQLRDVNGNALTASGGTVALAASIGTLSGVTDVGNGSYTATYTATTVGSATISGTLNGSGFADTEIITVAAGTPPQITGPSGGAGAAASATSVAENTASVFTFTASEAVTWSLTGGADQARFSINSGTGALTFTVAPDFESPTDAGTNNTYEVIVTATGGTANVASQTLTVTVTDVVEVSPITINDIANTTVSENATYTSATPGITGTPIGTVTYTLGGVDAAAFSINGSTGVVSMVARNFEAPADVGTDNVYDITITATDTDGNADSEDWSVTVTDVTESATLAIGAVANTNAAENTPYSEAAPGLTGTPIGSVTYTLSGADAADFTVNAGTGAVSMVARNFESPVDANTDNIYEVTLVVTDADGNTDSEDWTVTVTDVVEASGFTIDAVANTSVAENATYTSVTPAISGAPIGAVTYTIGGADAARFTINPSSGIVSMIPRNVEGPVDANTNNVYELTITATDSDGNADSEDWTVTVTNVADTFTINAIADASVNENAAYTGPTPSLGGDTPFGTVTYTLGGADAAAFTIDPSTGVVSMVARNFEGPVDANTNNGYEVTITGTDGGGNTASESWTVNVQDVVETANFTINAISDATVNENAAYTGPTPALAGDAPIGTVTYTLGGADAGDFTIDPSTGVVSMVARSFESPVDQNTDNVYEVTITATDSDGNLDSEDWLVTVQDVIETATFTINAIANETVNENAGYTGPTPVLAGDAPIGSVTYTLGGNDAADFTIDPSTGVVSMVARSFESPEDANTDNIYELTITATDADGNADTEDWTVQVLDAAELATFTINAIGNASVNENSPYTGPTPSLAGDAPIGTVTYSIVSVDAGDFTIDPATGVVSMVARDREAPVDDNVDNVYEVTIRATDSDGNTADESWTVTVLDVDEIAPTFDGTQSVPADDAIGVAVGTNIVLDFSEAVVAGTAGTIEIRLASDNSLVESFDVATQIGTGDGQVDFSGDKVTLNPTAALSNTEAYYITVSATAVRDVALNLFAGFSAPTTYNFTTSP